MTPQRTPVPLSDLRDAIVAGFHSTVVAAPHPDTVALAWAMLCHEHGVSNGCLWAVFHWSLGNWDVGPNYLGPTWTTVPEREVGIGGGEYKARHRRAAFEDAEAGAAAWWLRMRVGFAEAFDVLVSGADMGDADYVTRFARSLKSARYFTDDPVRYGANVMRHLAVYRMRWPSCD